MPPLASPTDLAHETPDTPIAVHDTSAAPRLSVLIPTHNRRELVTKTLSALAEQTLDHRQFEVVVMCDGCVDGTQDALRALNMPFALHIHEQPQSGVARARNNAASHAIAPVILLLDDDIIAPPALLAEHLNSHAGQPRRVVIGRLLPDPNVPLKGWTRWEQSTFDRRYRAFEDGSLVVGGQHLYSGNVSIDRALFAQVGGFNPDYRRGEDTELGYRLEAAGGQFFFNGRAAGIHCGVHTLQAWRKIQYDYGRYDVQFAHREGHATRTLLKTWWDDRHLFNRALSHATITQPRVRDAVLWVAHQGAALADRLKQHRASRWCYSAIANVQYWNGVADELGGAGQFARHIVKGEVL